MVNMRKKKDKGFEELISELYRQVGQLKVELDWLKKNLRNYSHRQEERSGTRESKDFIIPPV